MNTAFSRVAPVAQRLISSKASGLTRTARKSFSSIVCRQKNVPSAFAFAQGHRSSSTSANKLADRLAAEITSELAEDEIDQEFVDAKKQTEKSFTITENVGEGLVKLTREYGNETIEVTFDCQDEAEMDMHMGDDELETPEEDDEEEGPSMEYGINTDVTITKAGGEKIIINCVSAKKLAVRSIRYVEAGADIEDPKAYGGPVFDQLNEELQESFYTYLADRKIDEDLAFFVLSYSRVKEQKEYSNWLNKVMEFSKL